MGQRPVTTAADRERVIELLAALGGAAGSGTYTLTIPGVPYSKSRPRFNPKQRRAYHNPDDKRAEQTTGVYLRATVRQPFTGNVALACVFFRPTKQRVDVDNLLKHVCDAANGVLWVDDCQCTGLSGVLDLDRDDPRTVVAIAPHVSGMVRDLSQQPKNPKGGLPLWD
ncbi:hypothetical protein MPUL_53740 [Mycolicibacterium pulveris]|uniref:Uncharacterized protein n=1 Tax=Mycolicibacterium pulveris TaxID=36813 RepID=A0A7I7UW11_MYCPV|nr:hypothetical protein MPUL_53740 [Mycolicibacterium pulveris]